MKSTGCKLKSSCLLTGKRVRILGVILLFQIIFMGPLGRNAFSWGSFRGIAWYIKVTDTHQEIIKAAYNLLWWDPAVNKTGFMVLGDNSYLNAGDILQYEGVDVGPEISSSLYYTFGPGPDATGSTPYSWHWYNPKTFSGYAPRAASSEYFEFALSTLLTSFDREKAMRGMAWSAHFVADMFVPFHVNGVQVHQTTPLPENGKYVLGSDESGPLYLCNFTPSTRKPTEYEDMVPYVGFGLNSDFSNAYSIFNSARDGATLLADGSNPVDWFDPWYWNGKLLSDALSSHATFEANAHAAWLASGGINNPVFTAPGHYDALWENGRPEYEFKGNAAITQSEQVWRFASRVASRTKDNATQLFMSPAEGIRQAVFGVYTIWRSAFSALKPGIFVAPDPLNPGKITVSTFINNCARESCQNVQVRLTVLDGSAVVFQQISPTIANLPSGNSEIRWTVGINNNRNYNIVAEVVGAFMTTPDLQFAYCSQLYQTASEPQDEEQKVFGDDKWFLNAFTGNIYYLPEGTSQLPDFSGLYPVGKIYARSLNIPERAFDSGFPNVTNRFEWFAIRYTGEINIKAYQEGEYAFRLTSDDGSRLIIDNTIVINNDGVHATASATGSVFLSAGIHKMTIDYFQGPRLYVALIFEVKSPGSWLFSVFNKDDYQ